MPDPNKKISTPSQDSPCEIKLACAGGTKDNKKSSEKIINDSPCEIKLACAGGANNKKKTCEKIIKIEKTETPKRKNREAKTCKSAEEKQATLIKEPCPLGVGCQLARPEQTTDPAARIDKEKPGCINFEACEEDEVEDNKLETGCLDFEDCDEYLKEEKKRVQKMKAERKQRKKEEMEKAKAREAEREEKS